MLPPTINKANTSANTSMIGTQMEDLIPPQSGWISYLKWVTIMLMINNTIKTLIELADEPCRK